MRKTQQHGVAIVTVLLIVAAAVVMTTSMVTNQHRQIRLASSYQSLEQAQALAVAGERFAAAVLKRDFDSDGDAPVDSREDQWATTIPPLPIAGGTITGCIHDLNGRYNLNNLVDAEGVVVPAELDLLRRLIAELALPSELASNIADWIDTDDQPRDDGAEFEYYSNLESPYRAANRPLESTTELRLVRGLNGTDADSLDAYQALLAVVSALPRGTTINVNTAPPAVLEALWESFDGLGEDMHRWPVDKGWETAPKCPSLDEEEGDINLATPEGEVDRTAHETVADFVAANGVQDKEGKAQTLPTEQHNVLSVHSDYFLVRAEIQFNDTIVKQYSVLHRSNDGKTAVRARWRSFD